METKLATQTADNVTVNPTAKPTTASARRPYYAVNEIENAFEVRVDLPGVNKSDIQISLENKELWIHGRRSEPQLPEGKWLHREISPADYVLRLNVNADINAEAIKAKAENGVLSVILPIAAEALPRSISVE